MQVSLNDELVKIRAAAALELRERSERIRRLYSELVMVTTREEADALDAHTRRYRATSPRQEKAYQSTRVNLQTLFGGAKGGSKSVGGARIAQRDIANSRDGVHLVLRQNYTDLITTTRQTYEQYFPPALVKRYTDRVWKCINGWEIWFYAADESTDPNFEKIGGLEVTTVHVDEASQLPEKFYRAIPATLRRDAFDLATGQPIHHYIYNTANPIPGQHWTKKHFVRSESRKPGHAFIQSLPDENPLLPSTYIDVAFSTMEGAMLQMLRFGDWNIEESEFKIVHPSWLHALNVHRVYDRTPKGAGIDIGLGHPDQTRVYCFNDRGEFWREDVFQPGDNIYDTTVQIDRLMPLVEKIRANNGRVAIDAGSVGKGISDTLYRTFGQTVIPVNFGEAAEEEISVQGQQKRQYQNRRAQIYYWMRLDVEQAAKAHASDEEPILRIEMNDQLSEDLDNTYYLPDPSSGKIALELKDAIKKRLGRSPDDGDALVLGNVARRAIMALTLMLPSPRGTTANRPGEHGSRARGRRRGSSIDFTGFN